MQIPPRRSHVGRTLSPVESCKLTVQLACVGRSNSSLAAGEKELLNSRVPEAFDHASSVYLHATRGKCLAVPCAYKQRPGDYARPTTTVCGLMGIGWAETWPKPA